MDLLQPRSVQFVNGDVSPADWKYAGLLSQNMPTIGSLSPNATYKLQLSTAVMFFCEKFPRRLFKIQEFLAGSLAVHWPGLYWQL